MKMFHVKHSDCSIVKFVGDIDSMSLFYDEIVGVDVLSDPLTEGQKNT